MSNIKGFRFRPIDIKGFRFRPTDVELIEYLQDETFGRDSLVQVIAVVQDICQFDPWQLPRLSKSQTGDGLWYFMYPPKYKYRNSKRISRTTPEGYWKPTGIPRKIINGETGEEIGSKKTLVFYKGQCHDKIKNKTCWVMHEYELKVDALTTVSDHKILNLCKLKKKVDISSGEAGQSSQHTLSNLVNHVANNAISEDLLEPNRSNEPEESNGHGSVVTQSSSGVAIHAGERSNQNNMSIEPEESNGHGSILTESSSIEIHAGERSNQHNNMVIADEGFNINPHSVNPVTEDAIPEDQLHLKEVSTEGNRSNNNNNVKNLYSRIEQDNNSRNSIPTNDDETFPTDRSNQHNMVDAAEGFKMPSSLEWLALDDDLIPTDFLYNNGISLDELLTEPDAANDSNWIQNQFLTNKGDGDAFLNSITANTNEAYLQEGNKQHFLAANSEGFGLPCMDLMELSNSMGKSRKRQRIEDGESSHNRETAEAQRWGK